MKLFVRAHAVELSQDPELAARLATPGYRARVERGLIFELEAFDWNCRQHITPRFSLAEVEGAVGTLKQRIAALEAENRSLREAAAGARAEL